MPKTKKMHGSDSDEETEGKGLRVRMSRAQHRTLKRGGKITLKPEMLDEMGEFVPMAGNLIKKVMSAMNRGKGMRITRDPSGIPSNSESLLGEAVPQPQLGGKGYRFGDFLNDARPVTDFLAPIAVAGREKAIDKIKASGYHFGDFLKDVRPVTDFLRPVAEVARERGIDKIKGMGMEHYPLYKRIRGKGYHFNDFLRDMQPVFDFLRPLAEAARDKGVDKIKGMGYRFGDFLNDARPVTDFLAPVAEAGREKAIEKIKASGLILHAITPTLSGMEKRMYKTMRGKGYHFNDFLRDMQPIFDFVRPLAEAARDKGVDKIKGMGKLTITHGGEMDGGSFLAAGGMGSTAGNSGMIQLGSPYQHPNSPAMNPFIPQHSQLSGINRLSTHKSSRIYRK